MTKSQGKNLISCEQKELLKWNREHFSSFLNGSFALPKIVSEKLIYNLNTTIPNTIRDYFYLVK